MLSILKRSRRFEFIKEYRYFFLLCIVVIGVLLRFYQVSTYPPGLYIDEVSIAYNAHTILEKGVDEHGQSLPLFFKAFGEYKLPVYIYLTSVSEFLWGKNEFAVRFPSALFGSLTVVALFFVVDRLLLFQKKTLQKNKYLQFLPLLSAGVLAITPWHIHFSRAGFEANVALFFYVLALFFSILYFQKKQLVLMLASTFLFVITLYTYSAYRIFAPLSIFALFGIAGLMFHKWRHILIAIIFSFVISLPMILFSTSEAGLARFAQTSAFSEYQNLSLTQKIVTYPLIILKDYLYHFSFDFLFVHGDYMGRHQLPGFGVLYFWQLPLLVIGIVGMLKKQHKILAYLAFSLLLIAPLAAAVALPSPHTLRALLMVIPISIFTGYAFVLFLNSRIYLKKILLLFLILFIFIESAVYLHFYYEHYPRTNAPDWGGAFKEVVKVTSEKNELYDKIVVDKKLSFAPIYFHYYNDSLSPMFVDEDWQIPSEWKGKKILYIRPFGIHMDEKLIQNIYLPYSNNNDVFAQFWELNP